MPIPSFQLLLNLLLCWLHAKRAERATQKTKLRHKVTNKNKTKFRKMIKYTLSFLVIF